MNELSTIVSLAKRRGFIFQSSEIYGGLASTYDYGPLGVEMRRNIKDSWWKTFVHEREDIVGLDSAILMAPQVWDASGHTSAGFADPWSIADRVGSVLERISFGVFPLLLWKVRMKRLV